MEVYHDARVYDTGMVTIIECMGRHAGWLTAAAALAQHKGNGPDLIYVPEVEFDMDAFIESVRKVYDRQKKCIVAVSEGIRDKDKVFITEYANKNATRDSFGHAQLGGLAAYLANEVKKATGAKVRGIELSLLQRCGAHCASKTDIDEAFLAGKTAVEAAVSGVTGKMVAFARPESGEYRCVTKLVDLAEVANAEKTVPREWINEAGNGMLEAYFDYALPLIQGSPDYKTENGLPRYPKLKFIHA